MDVPQITVDREQAAKEYDLYVAALKTKKDAFLHDLKVAYGHMRHGKAVLDIWQAFAEQGINEKGNPRIAIARADWTEVTLTKFNDKSSYWGDNGFQAIFSDRVRIPHPTWNNRSHIQDMTKDDVTVPKGTWNFPVDPQGHVVQSQIRTRVPIVPARFLPNHKLLNYHILWEVEKWDVITPPRDPFLLKRVSPNVFVVLAGWDLSPLERAVLRGRIA